MTSRYKNILPIAAAAVMCAAPVQATGAEADSLSSTPAQYPFRTVDQGDMLGGAEVLDIEKLMQVNYIDDLNSGTISGYVSGFNGNSLWGSDADNSGYLVLIDGVARDMNNVSTTEVKSVTFLKGAAATVLYGARAAKGVIYISTKRGKAEPLKIEVRANTGWHVAKEYPEYLGAAEYMTLYNKARQMDGLAPAYSAEDIYNTAAGNNPYKYPNLNMYSHDYVRKAYNRTDATAEISGGNERARFYTNVNYYRQGDYLKFGEAKDNFTDRFSVRGNVDVNITDWVSAYVNTSATFYNARGAHGNYWEAAASLRPNRITPLIPVGMVNPDATGALSLIGATSNIYDGCFLAGTQLDQTNIFADYLAKGYNKFTSRQFQFDTGVNVDLGMVLKGLSFNTKFAVDYATSYNTGYYNSYATFVPVWSNHNGYDEITGLTIEGKDEHSGVQNISDSQSRQTINWSGQFDYKRTFNDVHNLYATVIAAGWQRTFSGEYHRMSSVNLGFEADYNYDHRYYADVAVTGVHSSKLAPGHRQAWSPTATLGWRLTGEEWLKDNSVLNDLIVSVSGGLLHQDIDIPEYYMYSANYTNGGWYSWAVGGTSAAYPMRGENLDLTFIKRKEFTAGLRGKLIDMIDFNAMFFMYKTEGLISNNSTKFPSYFFTYYPAASFVPYVNLNDNKRTGFDFAVNFKKDFGQVNFAAGVTGTYYDTKAAKRDEVHEYAYQYREGLPLDGIWGYRCLGFFKTDEEAAAADQSALGNTALQAGDLKYMDVNNDGKVDTNDQVYLGKGGWYGRPFYLGANIQVSWKGFTLFVHGTGGFGANQMINGENYYRTAGDVKYSKMARCAWTPETAATATLPRLTTTSGDNNYVASDFWMVSNDYFDIDKIQLTYQFPKSIIHGPVVKGLEVYVSGSDLVRFAKNREVMDLRAGSAPRSRFYNIGAKVTF